MSAPDPAERDDPVPEVKSEDTLDQTDDGQMPVDDARLVATDSRMVTDRWFRMLCITTATISVVILGFLLTSIIRQGTPALTWTLLTSPPEPDPQKAGLWPALAGTIWVCGICALVTLPVGIATAVLLEEFKPKTKVLSWLYGLIQLNISNLAGVPSVVYGILGLTAFVSMFSLFGVPDEPGAASYEIGAKYYDQFANLASDPFLMVDASDVPERYFLVEVEDRSAPPATLTEGVQAYENTDAGFVPVELNVVEFGDDPPTDTELLSRSVDASMVPGRISIKRWYHFRVPFGRGVLAGALTLMLVILPVIIISTQEALRAVPSSLRDGALGLGSTPWQVVWNVTLPAAVPGIMTGSILAMSRAIGETAPILIIAGIVFIGNAPQHLMDDYTVLPLQIFNWTSRPQEDFRRIAAGGIIVLLAILLSFNAVAVLIRHRMQKKLS